MKIEISAKSWHYRLYCRPNTMLGWDIEHVTKPTNLCQYMRGIGIAMLQWVAVMLVIVFWKVYLRPFSRMVWLTIGIPISFIIYIIYYFCIWVGGRLPRKGFWGAFAKEWIKLKDPEKKSYPAYKIGDGYKHPKDVLEDVALYFVIALICVVALVFVGSVVYKLWNVVPQHYRQNERFDYLSLLVPLAIVLGISLVVRWRKEVADGWRLFGFWVKAKKAHVCPLIEVTE